MVGILGKRDTLYSLCGSSRFGFEDLRGSSFDSCGAMLFIFCSLRRKATPLLVSEGKYSHIKLSKLLFDEREEA